jgi:hypothetical protein
MSVFVRGTRPTPLSDNLQHFFPFYFVAIFINNFLVRILKQALPIVQGFNAFFWHYMQTKTPSSTAFTNVQNTFVVHKPTMGASLVLQVVISAHGDQSSTSLTGQTLCIPPRKAIMGVTNSGRAIMLLPPGLVRRKQRQQFACQSGSSVSMPEHRA